MERLNNLLDQLRQLRPEEGKLVELVIAWNSDPDNLVKQTKISPELGIRVVEVIQDKNVSFGENLETSISQSAGGYYLLMGDDDVVTASDLRSLLGFLVSKEPAFCVVPLANDVKMSHATLSAKDLYFRSGSMMGLCFRRDQVLLESWRRSVLENPEKIYPQIGLALSYACRFGHAVWVPVKDGIEQIAREDGSVSRHFSDHMSRPTDYGIGERIELAVVWSKCFAFSNFRALSWQIGMLRWGSGIYKALLLEGSVKLSESFHEAVLRTTANRPVLLVFWKAITFLRHLQEHRTVKSRDGLKSFLSF